MKPLFRILLPILIVLLGGVVARAIVQSKREVPKTAAEAVAPLVRVVTADAVDFEVSVPSQGTVIPRTESQVVAQVAGRISSVSESFAAGGVFAEGDLLLSIDSSDYKLAVVQARGQVANAELLLAQEKAEAKVAQKEWDALGNGEASDLNTHRLHVRRSEAALASAEATLEQAKIQLSRTSIRAPFSGRVRGKGVDLGQYVLRGTPLGQIFSDDAAEVRLPISDRDLAYLDLDLISGKLSRRIQVLLQADFAGEEHTWEAEVVRVESAIDPQTRMIHIVASIDDPYDVAPGRLPLSAGLFVRASVSASTLFDVIVLPREALRDDDTVLVVEAGRIRIRSVQVSRIERDLVVIESGLREGEVVCLSRLPVVTEGMNVRAADDLVVEGHES